MNRKEILEETVRQFLLDFPGLDVNEDLSYQKGVVDDVRFLLEMESRRARGVTITDEEKDDLNRLTSYGRDDLGPTRFSGYAMHDLDPNKKRLHELLTDVSIEAKKMRSEILR
jgi:hypothetical protein